jgi:hypothetical protein
LTRILNGSAAPFVPVAPVYEGLGPLEFFWMERRWQTWSGLLDETGTDRLPVAHETYLEVETSLYLDALENYYPPPAWLSLPTNRTPEETAGSAVIRRGPDLFWQSPGGEETWLPPGRATLHERQTREGGLPYAGLWDRGHRAEDAEDGSAASEPEPTQEEVEAEVDSGRYEVARALLGQFHGILPLYFYAISPYGQLLGKLGFQGLMTWMVERPDRVHRLLEEGIPRLTRQLAAAQQLSVGAVFLEECLASADLISPALYREFVFPYTRRALEFFESRGLRTVLYFSGNLMPRLQDLRQLPWRALSFEEDRKNYGIDLAEVRRVMGPDRVLFGNVDASFLERASDDQTMLEVDRQVSVGGPERFVLSVGSPFTPGTSLERVRLFCKSTRPR